MTPDEARALLDGAAPGEWQWDVTGNVAAVDGDGWEDVADYVSESNAPLIVAAPTLAALAAGMRTEYRAEYRETWGEWIQLTGWTTEESARHALMPDQLKDAPKRVLVRYVTNEEEIS